VRVVCLYRSQARRPNDLYLHEPTQPSVNSLRPSLLVVCLPPKWPTRSDPIPAINWAVRSIWALRVTLSTNIN
jgi:hypothetical protein